jgi:hypothetical protein
MDPDAALQAIIEAALTGDWRELEDATESLSEWLKVGGYAPGRAALVRQVGRWSPSSPIDTGRL